MKKILLPLLSVVVMTACQKETITSQQQEEIVTSKVAKRMASKIDICHYDSKGDSWRIININISAWPDHEAHGDVRLDDPDGDGYVPTNHCGYGKMGDCDDNNPAINPGAAEICGNNIDDNCNGQVDENCIPTVTICDQVWMLKNLDVTTYRNGDPIPQVTDPSAWVGLTTGAWCYASFNPANGSMGKLYNWYAVNDPRGLAPEGWHIPSLAEWNTFAACVGGLSVGGTNMQEMGWAPIAAGGIFTNGNHEDPGYFSWWWGVTSDDGTNAVALHWAPHYDPAAIFINFYPKGSGFSVRCLKD
jgi:uncharacterized protein (TIGR02145 family)